MGDQDDGGGGRATGPAGPDTRAGGDLTPSADAAAGAGPEVEPALSRRNFVVRALAAIGGGIAAVLGIPVVGFASAPGWQARTPVRLLSTSIVPTLRSSALTSVGKLTDFEVGVPKYVKVERPVIDGWVQENAPVGVHVVRTSEAEAAVFDPHCTHLGCPVAWSTGSKSFNCPCHGGVFDRDGEVVAGPPPRPLVRYETRIQDGELFIGALREGA